MIIVTLNILPYDHADFNSSEDYAKMCYVHEMPDLCISICDFISAPEIGHSQKVITLLKGKAYYKQYIKGKKKLEVKSLSEDMKKQQLDVCFQPCIHAIELLGEALDQAFIDDEGSYMLDRAMMDCIFRANMLDVCNRCYLCRRKLKGKEKLIKSHVIPHSILDIMSPVEEGTKQNIYAAGSSIKKASSRLLAPGEVVYYMLCHKCEGVVSVCGETQFSPLFFQKIYSEGDRNNAATKEQWIEYGPWLHQFSISLVFRAIRWDADEYLNDDILYDVFKRCRSCITSWTHKEPNQSDLPLIYIFISPISVGENEQMQYKYLKWWLTSSLNESFGCFDSKTSPLLLKPSFFVIQLGVVSLLVSFRGLPEKGFEKFVINPSGGSYWVPPGTQRKENIPSSLWALFIDKSKLLSNLVLSANPVLSGHPRNQDVKQSSNSFVGDGIKATAITSITQNLANLQVKFDHTLLPPQFSITSTPKKIKLPKGHTILLHSNYVREQKSGSTFFVVVGSGKKYPITRPYVIWHFYEPTGTITSGAFFSIETLQITDFLISTRTIEYKAMSDRSFLTAKERMPTILKELLEEKGFSSIFSLMHRVRTAHEAGR